MEILYPMETVRLKTFGSEILFAKYTYISLINYLKIHEISNLVDSQSWRFHNAFDHAHRQAYYRQPSKCPAKAVCPAGEHINTVGSWGVVDPVKQHDSLAKREENVLCWFD